MSVGITDLQIDIFRLDVFVLERKKPAKSHLGGVLGRPGRILRRLGGVGASWGRLGASGGRLGGGWGRLGGVLGRLL